MLYVIAGTEVVLVHIDGQYENMLIYLLISIACYSEVIYW